MGFKSGFKGLNAELNFTCYSLALLGAHHILHVSRIRIKQYEYITNKNSILYFSDRASSYNSGKWPNWRTVSSITCLFESSTCFEQLCAYLQEDDCINTTSGIITLKAIEWSKITKIARTHRNLMRLRCVVTLPEEYVQRQILGTARVAVTNKTMQVNSGRWPTWRTVSPIIC